jgi:5'-methylthioadenosine phosphorylase
MLGIIGGSGLENISPKNESRDIKTPYGIVPIQIITLGGTKAVFLSRHGYDHSIAPHQINYLANIWALHAMECTHIIATAAVGSLTLDLKPGMFGIADQFIDFTKNRQSTYLNTFKEGIKHIDMTCPYSEKLNKILESTMNEEHYSYKNKLTLIVTEGPRFETSAEIKAYSILGGDIVGMTGYPEVSLARELSMEYSCLAICTNYAAGITKQKLTHEEVIENVQRSFEKVKIIVSKTSSFLKDTV